MRKTSYGITLVGVALVLLLNIFSSTRTDWLVVKSAEVFNTKVTTRYGLSQLCETIVSNIPSSDGSDNGQYTKRTCRKFPLRQQDQCETDNSTFCAAWTSAGYAVELGIGFSALSLVAILFGVSTGSRRRRIWRAVAGLVALQALFQLVAFSLVTHIYRTAGYPTFERATPGTAYVFNTLSWVMCVVISVAVMVTGISADKGHRWAAGNRAYRPIEG
ncbi:hypothetical protein CPB85DRAFT_1308646 [Mucidula mucida]|nr:hypothetical protein CPB85DRAFT_1308646 [Mucidula mucida]